MEDKGAALRRISVGAGEKGQGMRAKRNCGIIVLGIVFLICIGHLGEGASGEPTVSETAYSVPYYAPPDRMELCREQVPLHIADVRERFDREFTIVVYSHAQVYLWMKRMERYFPWIEKELARNQLPEDLKFVAVAESDLILSAASPAGAAGPWQFIRSTGANYGLSQSTHVDERHDFENATDSAFRYLRDLHGLFSNWTLALAGYNCGEKRVQDEMRKQKVNSYYLLKLPLETERYVFRILAIKEVLTHPERYGYFLPKTAGYPVVRTDRVNLRLSSSLPLQSVAEAAGTTYREFKALNPAFVTDTIPEGNHSVKVPEGKGKGFLAQMEVIKGNQKSSIIYHKVSKGETLKSIAAQHNISEKSLRDANNIQGDKVRVGDVIKIIK